MTRHPIPDAALEGDIAILGKKGKGKSIVGKRLAERLLDLGRRVVVIDPQGHWWGLRSSADGKGPGFPIAVFGGDHGDMPLVENMARPLAQVLASENLPAILDLGGLRKAPIVRFVTAFLDELYARNRDPLWLVLEEADLFAPQNPMGDTAAVLGEVDRIARRGRAYGFRLITMTQRPARLHKDVLTQLSTLVAMGVTGPHDTKAIRAWVEGNADREASREVFDSLAKLPVGEGWVWAPDLDLLKRVQFPMIRTLDTSATPKAGEKRIAPKTLADVDIGTVREALDAAGAGSEGSAQNASENIPELVAAAEQRGFERGERHGREQANTDADAYRQRWEKETGDTAYNQGYREGLVHGRQIAAAAAREALPAQLETILLEHQPHGYVDTTPPQTKARKPPPAQRPAEPETPDVRHVPREVVPESLTPARHRILVALRQLEALGQDAPGKTNVAWFAGASPKSSAFGNNLGAMRSAGLIDYPGAGTVALTDAGRELVPRVDAPSHADLMAIARDKLTPAQLRMLEAAVDCYPNHLTTDELADHIGASPTSSAFGNNRGRLRSLGLITYPDGGQVRAADLLFP